MGMFDYFQPVPPVVCPYCGKEFSEGQGKSGPCDLLVWRQGIAAPVEQRVDEIWLLPAEVMERQRLPESFGFGACEDRGCRHCPDGFAGETENGVWRMTTVFLLSDAPFCELADLPDKFQIPGQRWVRNGQG